MDKPLLQYSIEAIIPPSSTLIDGTLNVTTAAAPLGTAIAISEVVLQVDPDVAIDVFVGRSDSQSFHLQPGGGMVIPIDYLDKIFAKTPSGTSTLNYLARV